MPIGVVVNALSVVIGGIAGALLGNKLTEDFKEKINMVLVMPISQFWVNVVTPAVQALAG